ncbi:MAG: substrate-binding domain-containing protein [Spirochaetota bacterium]|nr:MAG: substrate-binding domain-containing protein [Spirochaetota bacterium]
MKKLLIVLLIIAVAASMFLVGFKRKPKEEVMEEAAEEEMAADMDAIDPWFAEMRAFETPYINPIVKFTGVEGEQPVYDGDLVLTNGEVAKIRSMGLTCAYVDNNLAGEYTLAIHGGCIDTLEYLGVKVLAETTADFDPAKQKTDVESVMALDPDIVVGYPVDPTTGTEVFQPVVDAGKVLVLVSNRPKGYEPGREYVGISTNNPYDNSYVYTKAMIDYVGPDGVVGFISFSEDYFVLNVMDDATRDALKELAPNITVYEEGFVDWHDAGGIATAMVQKHPDIQAICTTWFDPAMVAVHDLRGMGRDDIKFFTFGMDTPSLIDLLDPNGMVKTLSTDFTWNVGMNTATLAAYGILGKEAPAMVVVPTTSATPDNLRELWEVVYRNIPLPSEIDDVLKKMGK